MSLFRVETHGQLEPHVRQEWLLTNGLGGFAASSVIGCNTRRYHGLLCAAMLPPVGRIMALNRVGEILCLDGNTERLLELSINQFRDRYHPRGDRYLRAFELNDAARWVYEVEGVRVVKELQLLWLRNLAMLRYRIEATPGRQIQLRLVPFVTLRDFHCERRAAGTNFNVIPGGRQVAVGDGSHTVHRGGSGLRTALAAAWSGAIRHT